MNEQKDLKIVIPDGCFEGHCFSCAYAKKKQIDSEGRIFCKMKGEYHYPYEKGECRDYFSKIKRVLIIIVTVWFVLGVLQLLLEILF